MDKFNDEIMEALRIAEELAKESREAGEKQQKEQIRELPKEQSEKQQKEQIRELPKEQSEKQQKEQIRELSKREPKKQKRKKATEKPRNVPKKLRAGWSFGTKLAVTVVVFLLVIVGIPCALYFSTIHKGRIHMQTSLTADMFHLSDEMEQSTPSVSYNGKKYECDENVVNILVVGVDQQSFEKKKEENTKDNGGQADAATENTGKVEGYYFDREDDRDRDNDISYTDKDGVGYTTNTGMIDLCWLVSINPEKEVVNTIAINRDSITEVRIEAENGQTILKGDMQLTLAYAYGDGENISINTLVKTVSQMLYDIPIHGYVVFDMRAIPKINDMVNGATLIPTESVSIDVRQGDCITMNGENALDYMEVMDTLHDSVGANERRIDRQLQYLEAWYISYRQVVHDNKKIGKEIYDAVKQYVMTNIRFEDVLYLYSLTRNWDISFSNPSKIPGLYDRQDYFDEYIIDRNMLRELILDLFYEKQQ